MTKNKKITKSIHGKKILITTPIYYPNDEPHIGSATTSILADFFKRFFTIIGYDVLLTTGTDEHGDKVGKTAKKNNMTPQEFCDINAKKFIQMSDAIQMSYDDFIRTTSKRHEKTVLSIWNQLSKDKYIYQGEYAGYYCESEEAFYTQKELYEKNGNFYTQSNKLVKYIKTPCHFLKLHHLKEEMLNLFKQNNITYPVKYVSELAAFIDKEFKDLCVSRKDTVFGIKVPNSTESIYVWLDALPNYLTGSNFSETKGEYWNEVIHLVGKDILIFHGLFWPAILILLSLLPSKLTIFVHNWWLFKAEKMSKSTGNVVNPMHIIEKYGASCLRFYCIFKNLINSDVNFDEKEMIELFNTYMVNKFSNLVHRINTLLNRNKIQWQNIPIKEDIKVEEKLKNCYLNINEFIKILFDWCNELNAQIDQKRPWEQTINNKNIEIITTIAAEIKIIIKYMSAICPDVQKNFDTQSFPIFNRLKYHI